MKRKTNLFYTTGPDSKFLTFSNYTESLTGNFLSTDTKLYPSMFLCINLSKLNNRNRLEENKTNLINQYLCGYYENKLAVLRDYCNINNQNVEDYITPLGYLLDTLHKFDNSFDKIEYIGDITEQDYNGTYTDTICTISFNNIHTGKISFEDEVNTIEQWENEVIDNTNILYGWKPVELNNNIQPILDVNPDIDRKTHYLFQSESNQLEIENKTNTIDEIRFNLVIPLFDVTNINYRTQHYINENIESLDHSVIELNNISNNDLYRKFVPLGIWFADDEIILKKDSMTNFSQSWSLMISSQFKPFPYAFKETNQVVENSMSNAYPTFAMILAKQNEILNMFMKVNKQLNEQQQQIQSLQAQLNNKASDLNIDKLQARFIDFEYNNNRKFNKLEETIKEYMQNFAWNATE